LIAAAVGWRRAAVLVLPWVLVGCHVVKIANTDYDVIAGSPWKLDVSWKALWFCTRLLRLCCGERSRSRRGG